MLRRRVTERYVGQRVADQTNVYIRGSNRQASWVIERRQRDTERDEARIRNEPQDWQGSA